MADKKKIEFMAKRFGFCQCKNACRVERGDHYPEGGVKPIFDRQKRHSWSAGLEQKCINPGCPWRRRWDPSPLQRTGGETKRRPTYFRDDAHVQMVTPPCGRLP